MEESPRGAKLTAHFRPKVLWGPKHQIWGGGAGGCFNCGAEDHWRRQCLKAKEPTNPSYLVVGPDRVLAAVLAGRSRLCTDCEALTSHEKFNINVKINGRSTSAIRDTGSLVRCVRGYLVSPECHTGRTRPVGGVFQGQPVIDAPVAMVDIESLFFDGRVEISVVQDISAGVGGGGVFNRPKRN